MFRLAHQFSVAALTERGIGFGAMPLCTHIPQQVLAESPCQFCPDCKGWIDEDGDVMTADEARRIFPEQASLIESRSPRDSERTTTRLDPIGAVISMLGITCLVVSAFLPYLSPPPQYQRIVNNTLMQHDGWMFLVLAGAAALGLLLAYRSGLTGATQRGICVAGVVAAIFAGIALGNKDSRQVASTLPQGERSQVEALLGQDALPDVVASPGTGIYAALVGGVLLLVGGLALRPRTARRPEAPPGSGPPEGWYANGPAQMRWWDGARWTDAVRSTPAGVAADQPGRSS